MVLNFKLYITTITPYSFIEIYILTILGVCLCCFVDVKEQKESRCFHA